MRRHLFGEWREGKIPTHRRCITLCWAVRLIPRQLAKGSWSKDGAVAKLGCYTIYAKLLAYGCYILYESAVLQQPLGSLLIHKGCRNRSSYRNPALWPVFPNSFLLLPVPYPGQSIAGCGNLFLRSNGRRRNNNWRHR